MFVPLMLAPVFFSLVFFYGYPTLFNLYNSLTDLSLLGLKTGGTFIGLQNYAELLSSKDFYRVLWNTLFWLTAVSVTLRIVLGLLLALLLNSSTLRHYKLTTASRLLLLVPWATPPIVAVVVWRWLLDGRQGVINQALQGLGLIDTPIAFLANINTIWPAIVTIIIWNTLPLVTLTFLAGLQSVPQELLEAAEMDGTNAINRFFHVTLPCDAATFDANRCGHDAVVDFLDVQQLCLCLAGNRRRAWFVHECLGHRNLYQGIYRF